MMFKQMCWNCDKQPCLSGKIWCHACAQKKNELSDDDIFIEKTIIRSESTIDYCDDFSVGLDEVCVSMRVR